MTPRILIIAGSDSGGGAGIQADIKTVTMLGGHAMTAITAITAQNTLGVQAVMPVPTGMVLAQITSCVSDIGVDAIKIGMLGSAKTAHAVADALEKLDVPIVFDPVMVATSGDVLADADTIAAFERLMRIATVTTPNQDELEKLSGETDRSDLGVYHAAGGLAEAYGRSILVTGTTISGGRTWTNLISGSSAERPTEDFLYDRLFANDVSGFSVWEWPGEVIVTTSTHGTGCTLASAIATFLAKGQELSAAVVQARQFVRLAIHDAPGLGGGHGPMGQQSVRLDLGAGSRLNQVTVPLTDYAASIAFYRTLGLKQIVATEDGHYARFEAPGGATLSVERGARPTVFLECDGLDAEVARLQAAGMAFGQLPTGQDWGWREARLTDPAGNLICLYQAGENRRYPPWRLPDA